MFHNVYGFFNKVFAFTGNGASTELQESMNDRMSRKWENLDSKLTMPVHLNIGSVSNLSNILSNGARMRTINIMTCFQDGWSSIPEEDIQGADGGGNPPKWDYSDVGGRDFTLGKWIFNLYFCWKIIVWIGQKLDFLSGSL